MRLNNIFHPARLLTLLLLLLLSVTSCEKEEPDDGIARQTLFMYLPWSGNLLPYFQQNIADLEKAIVQRGLNDERVIVFLSETEKTASLYEIEYIGRQVNRKLLRTYTDLQLTTAQGITRLLKEVVAYAPAYRYGMVIGCHGMGWMPVGSNPARSSGLRRQHVATQGEVLLTRYFGGTSAEHQTEITDLAQGISDAGIKMEYILFDDCYMSSIEVAYDLRHVAGYLIGCPTEVMAYGMPYQHIGKYLLGEVSYEGICQGFYDFYAAYPYPYGTIGVTKCSEVEALAGIMKEINAQCTFDTNLLSSLQRLDGYTPVVFFDCGDYVAKLCGTNTDLLQRFQTQLSRTVIHKRHTKEYYSMFIPGAVQLDTYSGVTISDPSINSKAVDSKKQTAWYRATHSQ